MESIGLIWKVQKIVDCAQKTQLTRWLLDYSTIQVAMVVVNIQLDYYVFWYKMMTLPNLHSRYIRWRSPYNYRKGGWLECVSSQNIEFRSWHWWAGVPSFSVYLEIKFSLNMPLHWGLTWAKNSMNTCKKVRALICICCFAALLFQTILVWFIDLKQAHTAFSMIFISQL